MSFVSPWYLLGLLGIGIPLAIHLIRRQRAERVVLPTMRFLKRAPKKLVYFQRFQQWLLLVLPLRPLCRMIEAGKNLDLWSVQE